MGIIFSFFIICFIIIIPALTFFILKKLWSSWPTLRVEPNIFAIIEMLIDFYLKLTELLTDSTTVLYMYVLNIIPDHFCHRWTPECCATMSFRGEIYGVWAVRANESREKKINVTDCVHHICDAFCFYHSPRSTCMILSFTKVKVITLVWRFDSCDVYGTITDKCVITDRSEGEIIAFVQSGYRLVYQIGDNIHERTKSKCNWM